MKLLCCTEEDAGLTRRWLTEEYGFRHDEVAEWVDTLHFNWPLSVKAIDDDGQVVGLLNMSDYRISEETQQMAQDEPDLLAALDRLRYTAVFSFIVAPTYRGTALNYQMFCSILPELREGYDFVFIPVLHRLRTHGYWQRWGALEFYRDADCVYYALPLTAAAECVLMRNEKTNGHL